MTHSQSLSTPETPANAPVLKTLTGVMERITYQNEETGYTVARLLPERARGNEAASDRGDGNLVTVVGNMVGVAPGEALELVGLWKSHPRHGWQFVVENYRTKLPATEQGIRKYLGSGLIKGVGPKTAEKIVAHFGTQTIEVLEGTPERLREVPRLGPHKAGLIAGAWEQQKAIKEVMLFLQGHGVSTSLAVRIYKEYGDAAITVAKNDPYRLARDVWGIGFKTADKIAQAMGIAPDDPRRLQAGTLYVLGEASDSGGHTYLPEPQLSARAAELLGARPEQVAEAIRTLLSEDGLRAEMVIEGEDGERTLVPLGPSRAPKLHGTDTLRERSVEYRQTTDSDGAAGSTTALHPAQGEQAVYLPPFHAAELGVANHLRRLRNAPAPMDRLTDLKTINFERMFEYLATREKLDLTERQKEGIVMALTQPVGVLTGGPGTGKTTSMRALIRVLTLKKKRIVLAAPTGRAAKRLSEATGLEAKTLHRLLQLRPGAKAQYDQDNPIPADVVIVDETSMLDTLLMNNLLKGIATGAHLLLVGDADQLPSVGAGNVLADIIGSERVPVVQLDHIFRQGAGSAIVTNAHRINSGQMPVTGRDVTDFYFFAEDDTEKAGELVVDLVTRRIPARFGFRPSDIQVLSPVHAGKCGVGHLNERLQEALNPAAPNKPQKQYGSRLFRIGDRVLQLRNNYDKDVYNGDSGVVTGIFPDDQELKVRLEDGREVSYDYGELDELTLAYALSIHKSQGSEYPVCVIPIAIGHYMLLERKLIYTAVTRAKKLVVLVGSRRALAIAVRNGPRAGGSGGRYTGLAARLT